MTAGQITINWAARICGKRCMQWALSVRHRKPWAGPAPASAGCPPQRYVCFWWTSTGAWNQCHGHVSNASYQFPSAISLQEWSLHSHLWPSERLSLYLCPVITARDQNLHWGLQNLAQRLVLRSCSVGMLLELLPHRVHVLVAPIPLGSAAVWCWPWKTHQLCGEGALTSGHLRQT